VQALSLVNGGTIADAVADEKGRTFDKAKLIADISPLPEGYSGTIKVQNVQSRIIGDTAILGISPGTVHQFTKQIYEKLHVHSRSQAVAKFSRFSLDN
jgi:hypothetical protein